jgi:hypothetical protein
MEKHFKTHLVKLTEYLNKCGWNITPYPNVVMKRDDMEAQNLFGKTAYYEPVSKTVVLYTTGRHPKDVLRSYAHEMRHHHQNLSGLMSNESVGEADPKYAQNNEHLRKLEEDAYLNGNMAFRDYCDNTKYGK